LPCWVGMRLLLRAPILIAHHGLRCDFGYPPTVLAFDERDK
jgi:hypothetical protein